jgi:hypothetical protein
VLRAPPRLQADESLVLERCARQPRPAGVYLDSLRRDAVSCGVPFALDALHVCLERAQVVAGDFRPRGKVARTAGVVDAATGRIQLSLAGALTAQLAGESLLGLPFCLLSQCANRLESEGEWSVFHRGPKRSGRVIV